MPNQKIKFEKKIDASSTLNNMNSKIAFWEKEVSVPLGKTDYQVFSGEISSDGLHFSIGNEPIYKHKIDKTLFEMADFEKGDGIFSELVNYIEEQTGLMPNTVKLESFEAYGPSLNANFGKDSFGLGADLGSGKFNFVCDDIRLGVEVGAGVGPLAKLKMSGKKKAFQSRQFLKFGLTIEPLPDTFSNKEQLPSQLENLKNTQRKAIKFSEKMDQSSSFSPKSKDQSLESELEKEFITTPLKEAFPKLFNNKSTALDVTAISKTQLDENVYEKMIGTLDLANAAMFCIGGISKNPKIMRAANRIGHITTAVKGFVQAKKALVGISTAATGLLAGAAGFFTGVGIVAQAISLFSSSGQDDGLNEAIFHALQEIYKELRSLSAKVDHLIEQSQIQRELLLEIRREAQINYIFIQTNIYHLSTYLEEHFIQTSQITYASYTKLEKLIQQLADSNVKITCRAILYENPEEISKKDNYEVTSATLFHFLTATAVERGQALSGIGDKRSPQIKNLANFRNEGILNQPLGTVAQWFYRDNSEQKILVNPQDWLAVLQTLGYWIAKGQTRINSLPKATRQRYVDDVQQLADLAKASYQFPYDLLENHQFWQELVSEYQMAIAIVIGKLQTTYHQHNKLFLTKFNLTNYQQIFSVHHTATMMDATLTKEENLHIRRKINQRLMPVNATAYRISHHDAPYFHVGNVNYNRDNNFEALNTNPPEKAIFTQKMFDGMQAHTKTNPGISFLKTEDNHLTLCAAFKQCLPYVTYMPFHCGDRREAPLHYTTYFTLGIKFKAQQLKYVVGNLQSQVGGINHYGNFYDYTYPYPVNDYQAGKHHEFRMHYASYNEWHLLDQRKVIKAVDEQLEILQFKLKESILNAFTLEDRESIQWAYYRLMTVIRLIDPDVQFSDTDDIPILKTLTTLVNGIKAEGVVAQDYIDQLLALNPETAWRDTFVDYLTLMADRYLDGALETNFNANRLISLLNRHYTESNQHSIRDSLAESHHVAQNLLQVFSPLQITGSHCPPLLIEQETIPEETVLSLIEIGDQIQKENETISLYLSEKDSQNTLNTLMASARYHQEQLSQKVSPSKTAHAKEDDSTINDDQFMTEEEIPQSNDLTELQHLCLSSHDDLTALTTLLLEKQRHNTLVDEWQIGHNKNHPVVIAIRRNKSEMLALLLQFDPPINERYLSYIPKNAYPIRGLLHFYTYLQSIDLEGENKSTARLIYLLKEGKKSLACDKKNIPYPAVIFLGDTGVGKSTIINTLSGAEFQYNHSKKALVARHPNKEIAKRGTVNSETLFPTLYTEKQHQVSLVDMPGFEDSRGFAERISAALSVTLLKDCFSNIKTLIYVIRAHVISDGNIQLLISHAERIGKIVKFNPETLSHLHIVISKGTDPDYDNPEACLERLQYLLSHEGGVFSSEARFVLENIQTHQLHVFPKLNKVQPSFDQDSIARMWQGITGNTPIDFEHCNFNQYVFDFNRVRIMIERVREYIDMTRLGIISSKQALSSQLHDSMNRLENRLTHINLPHPTSQYCPSQSENNDSDQLHSDIHYFNTSLLAIINYTKNVLEYYMEKNPNNHSQEDQVLFHSVLEAKHRLKTAKLFLEPLAPYFQYIERDVISKKSAYHSHPEDTGSAWPLPSASGAMITSSSQPKKEISNINHILDVTCFLTLFYGTRNTLHSTILYTLLLTNLILSVNSESSTGDAQQDNGFTLKTKLVHLNEEPALVHENQQYRTIVFKKIPNHTTALSLKTNLATEDTISEDTFDRKKCIPIEYYGRASVRCEGEKTTMVYQPFVPQPHQNVANYLASHGVNKIIADIAMHPFSDFTGNLMLMQLACHCLNQLFNPPKLASKYDVTVTLENFHHQLNTLALKLTALRQSNPTIDWTYCEEYLKDLQLNLTELGQKENITVDALSDFQDDINRYQHHAILTKNAINPERHHMNSEPKKQSETWAEAFYNMFKHPWISSKKSIHVNQQNTWHGNLFPINQQRPIEQQPNLVNSNTTARIM